MEILIALAVLLAVVTVVGHGIWIFLAALFSEFDTTKAAAKRPVRRAGPGNHCPRCDSPLSGHVCDVCEWPSPAFSAAATHAALLETARKIARFHDLGLIDAATYGRLKDCVAAEIRAHESARSATPAAVPRAESAAEPAPAPIQEAAVDGMPAAEMALPGVSVDAYEVAPAPMDEARPAAREALPPEALPSEASPSEDRWRQFVEHRALVASAAESDGPASAKAGKSRRAWTDLLAAFMEEKNIRWGELIGGLLIVGCSIALVVSFWAKIAERPFLKFFVFNGVTAGLFALGLYADRRWKLRTTSDGLLITAALLLPLNFLAIAAFTQGAAANDPLTLVGEAVSIGLFCGLLYSAGRSLTPHAAWLLAGGVMIPSILQLLIRRFIHPDVALLPEALGLIVLATLGTANGWGLARATKASLTPELLANAAFKLLGLTLFAALLSLGLLAAKTGTLPNVVHRLSPLVCLAGLTPLGVGLFLWRRLTDRRVQELRTAALGVAVAAALMLLAGVALAWPTPAVLLPSVALTAAALIATAFLFDLPEAHLAAAPAVVLGTLVSWYTLSGDLRLHANDSAAALEVLLSARSGQVLLPLFALLAGVAGTIARRRPRDARCIAGAALGVAGISLALVSWFGFGVMGDPWRVTWIYAVYALVVYFIAEYTAAMAAFCVAAALTLAASVQGVVFLLPTAVHVESPWLTALLVAASIWTAVAAGLIMAGGALRQRRFGPLLIDGATGLALVACGLMVAAIPGNQTAPARLAWGWSWLAGICLALAALASTARSQWLFTAFQASLTLAAWFGVAARLVHYDWLRESQYPWRDPWTLTAEGLALVTLSLAWICARLALQRATARSESPRILQPAVCFGGRARGWLNPPWPSVDVIVLRLALMAFVGLAIYAAIPGAAQELSPRLASPDVAAIDRFVPPLSDFEWVHIPHDHAAGWGMWLWMALLAVALLAEAAQRGGSWHPCGVFLLAAMACPLLAHAWQAEVATASALRWLSAGYLLLASAPIWLRGQLAERAARSKWSRIVFGQIACRQDASELNEPWQVGKIDTMPAVATIFGLSLAPLLAMGIYVGLAAMWRTPPTHEIARLFGPLGIVFVVAAVLGIGLRFDGFVDWHDGLMESAGRRRSSFWNGSWAKHASSLLLILGTAPLAAVTVYAVAAALRQSPLLGPEPTSWFVRMGLAASYAVPVLITALTLVGYGIRERSSRYAFAGGLVGNLGITAGYLLAIATHGLPFDATQWIRLAQLNAGVSAVYALPWLGGLVLWNRRHAAAAPLRNDLLGTQVGISVALNGLVLLAAWCAVVFDPRLSVELAPVGDLWGWVALGATAATVMALGCAFQWPNAVDRWLALGWAVGTLIACSVGSWQAAAWLAFHVLLAWHVGLLVVIAGIGGLIGGGLAAKTDPDTGETNLPWRRSIMCRADIAAVIAALLAWRAIDDPTSSWWSVGALKIIGLLAAWFACWSLRRGQLHAAALAFNLAAGVWWSEIGRSWFTVGLSEDLFGFAQCSVIALALPAIAWVILERRVFRPAGYLATQSLLAPMHRLAARLAACTVAGLLAWLLLFELNGNPPPDVLITGQWLAVLAATAAAVACLWDDEARDAVALVYVAGLAASVTLVESLHLTPSRLLWLGTIALSAYGLATSFLWSRREGLRQLADALRIPRGEDQPCAELSWLVPANAAIAAVVVALAFAIELTYAEMSLRIMVAIAALAQAASIGLLARGMRRSQLQFAALALGAIGAVAIGWAPLAPGAPGELLNRGVAVTAALAVVTVLYGLVLTKLLPSGSQWLTATRRMVPVVIVACAGSLAVVLGTEGMLAASEGEVVMAWPAIVLVAATLLGLCVAALAAAVLPGRDPLGLSKRGRQLYVYAAEVVLALLLVHTRLTMPWLFQGVFERYWPLIVMLIAFVGAGVGEWLRRRRLTVVGQPLENTGALLPLLPVLGYWIQPAEVDYSLLLLAVGLLYMGLSVARKSFGFGVLAALAANGSLWYLLDRWEGYRLLDHPQLWLIPPALCVLAAAHINRRQLSASQLTGVRYGTSITVYVSSTADIFINGVGQAPWLPFVLAGLALAGIFAGILLRIRTFLFLGTAFLVVALLSIIWHAAVDLKQTWLWSVSGIVTGILIIAVFAVFEKKRDTVLSAVEQLKQWQS